MAAASLGWALGSLCAAKPERSPADSVPDTFLTSLGKLSFLQVIGP